MAESFPNELQDLLNQAGFTQQFGKTTIRSTVDVGPAKIRSRFTKEIDRFSCSIDLEKDDYSILSTFYKTTLNNGVRTFNYNHPMTGVESEFRFVEPPSITPIGGLWFKVGLSWEEMP